MTLIPILPELTAKPTAPKSAIAPQLLVGVASFPALLEQSGIALPDRLERKLPGIEQAPDQPDLQQLPSPVDRERTPRLTLDSGNGVPDPGSLLPLDLPHDDAARRGVPIPRGNLQIPEVSLSAEQREAPLDRQVSERPNGFERPSPLKPTSSDDSSTSPEPPAQSAPPDAPPSPAVSGVAALEEISVTPDGDPLSRPSQMIERSDGQSTAERGSSSFAPYPQPVATQSIGVTAHPVSTGKQADQRPRAEASPPAYPHHTPHSPPTAPEVDALDPSRSSPEAGTLKVDPKTDATDIREANGARQIGDTSEPANEPEFLSTSQSPRADQATLRAALSLRVQHNSEPAHQALKTIADPPTSIVTHASLTSAEPQPTLAPKTAISPQSTGAIPIAGTPQVTAAHDVVESAVEAKSAAPQAPPTAHPPASTTPPVADVAAANTLNPTQQPVVSHTPAQLENRPDLRVNAQVEATIEQLVQARETGRAARPEMTVRHSEFGAINVRIEAVGTDLRATLNARDPGFMPAIHAALAERGIAAPTDAASSQSQRGHDQGSGNANSHSGSAGQGQHSDPRYGNSLGSGQASSQPYREQSKGDDDEASAQHPTASPESDSGLAGASGLFA